MRDAAIRLFETTFGARPTAVASAPGRVNLLGEHTDYNGGPVLPIALAARTAVAVGPGPADTIDVVSSRLGRRARVGWKETLPSGWGRYVAGVMRELSALHAAPGNGGARLAVASEVTPGAGLASSAALTVAAARALAALAGATLAPRQIAGVAFRAEHDHVGVPCGIMDQTIAALGKPGRALFLECATLLTRHVPFTARLLLVDTGVRHALARSAYRDRRAECRRAVERLKVELPELMWLASWPVEWIGRLKKALPQPLRRRAVHVVSESARTRFAARLLERRQLARFGKLLYESHESCRRLYECSTPELDLVVAAAKRAGALGARLTGAGWGGAAIVLLQGKAERGRGEGEARVRAAIVRAFRKAYGREPVITAVTASGGARLERV